MSFRDLENWMWADALAVLGKAERLHRQFFQLGTSYGGPPIWEPPTDIFENELEICVCVALPGVDPAQIEIRMEPGLLLIRGERSIPQAMQDAAVRRLEIPYGRFERAIELPLGQLRIERQSLSDGCIQILLQKNQDET